MTEQGNRYRDQAAQRLRASRLSKFDEGQRRRFRCEAAGYKLLAHNEEWLAGEKQKSKARSTIGSRPSGTANDAAYKLRALSRWESEGGAPLGGRYPSKKALREEQ